MSCLRESLKSSDANFKDHRVTIVPLSGDQEFETDDQTCLAGSDPEGNDCLFSIRKALREEGLKISEKLQAAGKRASELRNKELALSCYKEQVLTVMKIIEDDQTLVELGEEIAKRDEFRRKMEDRAKVISLIGTVDARTIVDKEDFGLKGNRWEAWKTAHRSKKAISAPAKEEVVVTPPPDNKDSIQIISEKDIPANLSPSDIENALSVVPTLESLTIFLREAERDRSPEFLFHEYVDELTKNINSALRAAGMFTAPKGPRGLIVSVRGYYYHLIQIQKRLHSNVQDAYSFRLQIYVRDGSITKRYSACSTDVQIMVADYLEKGWDRSVAYDHFEHFHPGFQTLYMYKMLDFHTDLYEIYPPVGRTPLIKNFLITAISLPEVLWYEVFGFLFLEVREVYLSNDRKYVSEQEFAEREKVSYQTIGSKMLSSNRW